MKSKIKIYFKFRTQIFLPQDYIILEGEVGTEMYFLTEGLAEVIIKREDKRISIVLKKGSYFGEIALITNSLRTSDVRAMDFCVVEIFNKEDFDNLKKEFPSKNLQKK
jgi:CRP-like cAMP-binding protein